MRFTAPFLARWHRGEARTPPPIPHLPSATFAAPRRRSRSLWIIGRSGGPLASSTVTAHQRPFGQYVALHLFFNVFLGGACLQAQRRFQSVKLEEVSVGPAGGRTRAAVAGPGEVIDTLKAATRK